MNSQEANTQIEALEAQLAFERELSEGFETELEGLRSRLTQAEAEIRTYKADIWSIEEVQQALDAVSRTGSEFVIQMDQRLRATLNGMLGMVELLLNTNLAPTQVGFARAADASGHELLDMLNSILDYCRIDTGQVDSSPKTVSTSELLASVRKPFEARAEAQGLRFETRIASNAPAQLDLDPVHLTNALGHLLENAISHTKTGGLKLTLDIEDSDGELELAWSIRDTGSGMTPDELSRVFEAFERGENESKEGTGLGLPIVRRLAELMGGRLSLTSEPGEGTCATLRLPFTPALDPVPAPVVEPEPTCSTARILIVEDNDVNQKVARGFLKLIGCQADTAWNGQQAVEQLTREKYDLVLMDCMMPEVDGYEAAQRIRSGEAGEAVAMVPIIALTADDSPGARQECLRAGMDDYMTKPVRIDRLRSVLRIWLPPELRPSAE